MGTGEIPRLRGVFHGYAFVASVAAGVVLVALADGRRAQVATWIYAATVAAMFGASALYHRVRWRSPTLRARMRRLDHSAIFLVIAGTYTPVVLLALEGTLATTLLVVVWAGAGAGLVLNLTRLDVPTWVTTLVYVALGWVGVAALPWLFAGVGRGVFALLLAGGGLYTLGALVYALRRPDPVPAVFGYHEVFHLLVVAAAAAHYVAVSLVVLDPP